MADNNNNKSFDYSQLDEKQLDSVRTQLRSFTVGIKGPLVSNQADQPVLDAGCCHSSHADTDGWI